MILYRGFSWILVLLLLQTSHPDTIPKTESRDATIREIEVGNVRAIRDAGESGDPRFIPFLKRELKKTGNKQSAVRDATKLALAKLDDPVQLQEAWCTAIVKDDPLSFLHIGGWFSIQALQSFLAPGGPVQWDNRFETYFAEHRDKNQDKDLDAARPPASFYALKVLPEIVPNPPIAPDLPLGGITGPQIDPAERQKEIRIWQDWIASNREKLSEILPKGAAVDFSTRPCTPGGQLTRQWKKQLSRNN